MSNNDFDDDQFEEVILKDIEIVSNQSLTLNKNKDKLKHALALNNNIEGNSIIPKLTVFESSNEILTEKIPYCMNCFDSLNKGEYICKICSLNLCEYHIESHIKNQSIKKHQGKKMSEYIIKLKLMNN
jgi:hypothetical protein